MDGPGMSLFNGAGSIHLNTSGQRIEEEEAIEDQKRRNEELQNELRNGFDDFIDDDDESVNDSANFGSLSMSRSRIGRNTNNQSSVFKNPSKKIHSGFDATREANQFDQKKIRRPSFGRSREDGDTPVIKNNGLEEPRQGFNGFVDYRSQYSDSNPMYNHGGTQAGDSQKTEHFHHCYQAPIAGGFENLHTLPVSKNPDFPPNNNHSDEQLQSLYEMRVREVQRLGDELTACRRDATAAHDLLYGRLAVAEAERERAQLSLQQSQELVANSKHRITELERQVSTLNSKMSSLQSRNDELSAEVTAATASLMDAQHRLHTFKANKESAQNTDTLFKIQQDRYKDETEHLERDLTRTKHKLMEKENEILMMEKRFMDLERLKEDLLIEKGSTINRLAIELEQAQSRLAGSETSELKEKISHLVIERNTARLHFKDMAGKLEATASELVEARTKLIRMQEDMTQLEQAVEQLTEDRESDSFKQMTSTKTGRGYSSTSDKMVLLRSELTKSISSQKLKREQINKLIKTIEQKDQSIESYKNTENKLKEEIEKIRDKEVKMTNELRILQNQAELNKSNSKPELLHGLKSRTVELETELKTNKAELDSLRFKHSDLEVKYEIISSEIDRRKSLEKHQNADVLKENDKLTYQLKDARKQIDDLKNMYVEICGTKEKFLKELNELKNSDAYTEVFKQKALVDELKNELQKEKEKVDKLGRNLLDQQKQEFDDHLENYKQIQKATDSKSKDSIAIGERQKIIKQFEDDNSKLKLLCEDQQSRLKVLSTELEDARKSIKQLRSQVELQGERDRMITDMKEKAKQFEQYIANQKNRLMNRKEACTSPIADVQQSAPIINDQVMSELEEKIRQDLAKHFAIELRNMEGLLNNKLSETEEEYNSHMVQLGDMLKAKTREVSTLQEVIMSERIKLKEAIEKLSYKENISREKLHEDCVRQLEKCQKQVSKLSAENESLSLIKKVFPANEETNKKLKQSEEEIEKLKEKYRTIKKTALKYKEYIIERDKHVESEIERIKQDYETALTRIQQRLVFCTNDEDPKHTIKMSAMKLKLCNTIAEQVH